LARAVLHCAPCCASAMASHRSGSGTTTARTGEENKKGGGRFIQCACGQKLQKGGPRWEDRARQHVAQCSLVNSLVKEISESKFMEAANRLLEVSDTCLRIFVDVYLQDMSHLLNGLCSAHGVDLAPTYCNQDVAEGLREELDGVKRGLRRKRKDSDLKEGLEQLLSQHRSSPSPRRRRSRFEDQPPPAATENLDLVINPGDMFGNTGGLACINEAGGVVGHVYVCVGKPFLVQWQSGGNEVWGLRALESTRREVGVYEATFYIKLGQNRSIILFADTPAGTPLNEVEQYEHEIVVTLWQCPSLLARALSTGTAVSRAVNHVVKCGSWSWLTALRAGAFTFFQKRWSAETKLSEVQNSWKNPICSSLIVIFVQCALAELVACKACNEAEFNEVVMTTIHEWMPLDASTLTPASLEDELVKLHWTPVSTMPRVFRSSTVTS